MALQGEYIYDWPRPMVTVDALIFAVCGGRKSVLLIKRGNEPFKGLWAVPGGFVEMDEELETAAARELYEETGIEGVALKQMHTFGTVGRDPRGPRRGLRPAAAGCGDPSSCRSPHGVHGRLCGQRAVHHPARVGSSRAGSARGWERDELPRAVARTSSSRRRCRCACASHTW